MTVIRWAPSTTTVTTSLASVSASPGLEDRDVMPARWATGASRTGAVRNVLPAVSRDTSVTRTLGAVSVLASRRERSARGEWEVPLGFPFDICVPRCVQGTWNYDPYRGCQRCQCNRQGSVGGQCDQETGLCRCLEGFEGEHCDKCRPGYYNFPNCRACNCHPAGTEAEACK